MRGRIWQGSGWCWWGGQRGGGGLDVYDKGSHFLVSHFLGWGAGGGQGGVGEGWW